MSSTHQKRLFLIAFLIIGLSVGVSLILYALSQNINLFYSPTEVAQRSIHSRKTIRVGGMVVKKSVLRNNDLSVEFTITDFKSELKIFYTGILPDLFKEGQGIVAQGQLDDNKHFRASSVLAKHDEKYMPPEVATTLSLQKKEAV